MFDILMILQLKSMISCHYYCHYYYKVWPFVERESAAWLKYWFMWTFKLQYKFTTKMGKQNLSLLCFYESKLYGRHSAIIKWIYINRGRLVSSEWTHFIPELLGHRSIDSYNIKYNIIIVVALWITMEEVKLMEM